MNAVEEPKSKKRRRRKKAKVRREKPPLTAKPDLPALDPLEVARETARNAQEGNRKLALSVDALRGALETIVIAEVDTRTGLAVTIKDLKLIAVEGLDAYSALIGQSWRRNKIIASRVGDRSTEGLES